MKQVGLFYDAEEAQIARSYLRAHGLSARLPDEQALSAMPEMRIGLGGYRLLVPDDEVMQAERLLAAVEEQTGLPVCARCGSPRLRRIRSWSLYAFAVTLIGLPGPFTGATRSLMCRRCGLVQADEDDALTEEPA